MSEASFASLGPTLLARKGGAKPAMRPQLTPLPENSADLAALADEALEDLGWNDMGGDQDKAISRSERELIVSIKPDPAPETTQQKADFEDTIQSAEIVSIAPKKSQRPKPAQPVAANEDTAGPAEENLLWTKAKPKAAKTNAKSSRRAAFTLRLDTERHLKLRLAATMRGVSAQAFVTDALDAAFAEIEDLDALVERMKRD